MILGLPRVCVQGQDVILMIITAMISGRGPLHQAETGVLRLTSATWLRR